MYLFVIRVHRDVSGMGVEIDEKYFWKRTNFANETNIHAKDSISALLISGVELTSTIFDRKMQKAVSNETIWLSLLDNDFMFSPPLDTKIRASGQNSAGKKQDTVTSELLG